MNRVNVLLPASTIFLSIGCSTTSVDVEFRYPAEANIPLIQTIAFPGLAVDGTENVKEPNAARDLQDILEQRIDESGQYSLVSDASIEKALKQSQMTSSRLFAESESAQEFGSLAKADAVLVGLVKRCEIIERSGPASLIARLTGPNMVREATAKAHVHFKIIHVATGKVFAPITVEKDPAESVRFDEDEEPPVIDTYDLVQQALAEVADHYADLICMRLDGETIPLRSGASWLGMWRFLGLGDIEAMENGIEYAEAGHWGQAYETFRAFEEQASAPEESAAAHWNMGWMALCQDKLDKAEEHFETYKGLDEDPADLSRIKNLIYRRRSISEEHFELWYQSGEFDAAVLRL